MHIGAVRTSLMFVEETSSARICSEYYSRCNRMDDKWRAPYYLTSCICSLRFPLEVANYYSGLKKPNITGTRNTVIFLKWGCVTSHRNKSQMTQWKTVASCWRTRNNFIFVSASPYKNRVFDRLCSERRRLRGWCLQSTFFRLQLESEGTYLSRKNSPWFCNPRRARRGRFPS